MIYRNLTSCICCLFLLADCATAQDSLSRLTMPISMTASLFYDFPQSFGGTAGIELPLNRRHVLITKKERQKETFKDFIVCGGVGFYRYPFNHTGLFVLSSIGYRYDKPKPYYFEWLATFGLLRTVYDGTVYSVNDNGEVTTLPYFGRWYATTGFTVVLGHDFERSTKQLPLNVSLRPALWIQYPYNSFIFPHLSLQLSAGYYFRRFRLSVRQKQKHIIR